MALSGSAKPWRLSEPTFSWSYYISASLQKPPA